MMHHILQPHKITICQPQYTIIPDRQLFVTVQYTEEIDQYPQLDSYRFTSALIIICSSILVFSFQNTVSFYPHITEFTFHTTYVYFKKVFRSIV